MRRKIGQPRFIDPSLVEEGDEISVEHKENRGIVTTLRGIVAKRRDEGATRYLVTEEGATLLSWDAKGNKQVKVTLFAREEPEGSTIFELAGIDEVKKRIA